MASKEENAKGFLVIKVRAVELMKVSRGSLGICDSCNNAAFDGYYVAALNHWMCKDCYDGWSKRAKYYPEDSHIEKRNYERYAKLLNVK
ncbi:MAG: demethylase [Bacteroidales bacterium]|nr:demethylase [Bacteroidales bacterium]